MTPEQKREVRFTVTGYDAWGQPMLEEISGKANANE